MFHLLEIIIESNESIEIVEVLDYNWWSSHQNLYNVSHNSECSECNIGNNDEKEEGKTSIIPRMCTNQNFKLIHLLFKWDVFQFSILGINNQNLLDFPWSKKKFDSQFHLEYLLKGIHFNCFLFCFLNFNRCTKATK